MLCMMLGGARFDLDPAAISAIRFRAAYGESVVNLLAACGTVQEREGQLLRMCHMMIPPAHRPELLEFAALARRDGTFIPKALEARDALLARDPKRSLAEAQASPFDEYKVLALMVASGVDLELIYELPIIHLLSVVDQVFRLKNPAQKTYRLMTDEEMDLLYPG